MKKRVCLVTTTAFIANAFLRPHLRMLTRHYDVTLALNVRDRYPLDDEIARTVTVRHVPIERKIAPGRDVAALVALTRLFRRGRFDLVHSVSPKAGLLAMAAAAAAGVRVRLHTFQGEVWASKRGGFARAVLKLADILVARLATHALVVSRGEQSFLERKGILRPGRSSVLGQGSIAGVDTERFRPDPRVRAVVRSELGIPADGFLALYLGRIGRDKGVLDLARAFAALAADGESWLAFVGPDEEGLRPQLEQEAGAAAARLRFVAYTRIPQRYLAAADVVCLPSHREGFGLVLIEAGACGVPVLASRLYGTADAVVEGVTGLFHEPLDVADIVRQLRYLALDPELRSRMGRAGRERVETHFREAAVVHAMEEFYAGALGR